MTLGGGRGLCQRGGRGRRKSLKVLKVEVKVILSVLRKISVLGIKKHKYAAVRGGARRGRPLGPLVVIVFNDNSIIKAFFLSI